MSIRRNQLITSAIVCTVCLFCANILAQSPSSESASTAEKVTPPATSKEAEAPPIPKKVDVVPAAPDDQIRERLTSILSTTGWFINTTVEVKNGVVVLGGAAKSDEYKLWATTLANNTQDVAAVVNKMQIIHSSLWDLSPVIDGFRDMWVNALRSLPSVVAAVIILALTWIASKVVGRIANAVLKSRVEVPLLREVIRRAIIFVVIVLGIYFVLRVSGLTRLALTILGGTGLFGLVLGVAFKDIAENFLASVLLSVQRPFRVGDLVEIMGIFGYIDRLTIRTTIINTVDGNYVQIPNADVYKSNIRNYTNNPNRRDEFTIGVGYMSSLSATQEIAMQVLREHQDVLKTPEPSVLVDNFTPSLVNVKVYFWTNSRIANPLAVKSSLLRLIALALQEKGIIVGMTAPAAPAPIIFPKGVPIHVVTDESAVKTISKSLTNNGKEKSGPLHAMSADHSPSMSDAEQSINNESQCIREQSRQTEPRETSENLLVESNHPSA